MFVSTGSTLLSLKYFFFKLPDFVLLSPIPVYHVLHTFLLFSNSMDFGISPENGLLCTICHQQLYLAPDMLQVQYIIHVCGLDFRYNSLVLRFYIS